MLDTKEIYKDAVLSNAEVVNIIIDKIEIAEIHIDEDGYKTSYAIVYLKDGSEKTVWLNDGEAYINEELEKDDYHIIMQLKLK